ncbi:hypothetical protein GGR26_000181 [Lewinella marina]|uniref:Uncharacterized protein n=1 Tax=Neolewinella marina TaxID=438751 RepID=A0A2G0CKB6_9BACT|nr:hypothetical protein [Neolewinella marina]NJB84436.1 hypothetical protein [Neolewinella marina]PHL00371.1 hypothetical protein CGL56_04875 [Neolewinella marina]
MMKFIFLLFLFGGSSTALLAQCSQESIRTQITNVTGRMEGIGYSMVYLTRCGSLSEGESAFHDIPLYAGTQYKVFAVCDGDCPDLDLKIYDSKGNLVDDDTLDDYTPILDVNPSSEMTYRAKVIMYDCDVEPCYYAIRVVGE